MKTVLITGASGGIGKALCNYFSDRGMAVLAHARNEENAKAVGSQVNAQPVWGDVTKPDDVDALAKQVTKAGGVDWIVHNAGILTKDRTKGPHSLGIQAEVNVVAPYGLTEALMGSLSKSDDARVFVISSTAANFAFNTNYEALAEPNGSSLFGHYALSKSAANAVTIAMAKKWPEIAFASTEPGFVKTKMTVTNSSMPFIMSKLAGLIGDTPQKAAGRCFDFLLSTDQASGVVVQGKKVMDSARSRWAKPEAQASIKKLLDLGGFKL